MPSKPKGGAAPLMLLAHKSPDATTYKKWPFTDPPAKADVIAVREAAEAWRKLAELMEAELRQPAPLAEAA